MGIPTELSEVYSDLRSWLIDDALSLWWEKGGDRAKGGFFELIDQAGNVIEAPRRTRLVGRQIFAYAKAGRAGWTGPSTEIVGHGVTFLLERCLAPAGVFYSAVEPDGTPIRPDFDLYDQAFALFGLAAAVGLHDDPVRLKTVARTVRESMVACWKHPVAGFEESMPRTLPLKANPHMHILEACLAWIEAGPLEGDRGWDTLANEIAELCLSRFLHPKTGALREFFDGQWNTMAGEKGRIIEPGHQFEWAWLLKRWGKLHHRCDAIAAGQRLVDIAETYGVEDQRGIAFNELWDDFSIKDDDARLWPQTERLKAWLAMADIAETEAKRQAAFIKAATAARGLMKYFATDIPGLWHETMRRDGSFIPSEARASSLYHVMCAFDQLQGAVDKYA